MAVKNSKTQARRVPSNHLPGWVWLIIGMVLGAFLFLALTGLLKKEGDGFARFGPTPNPNAQPTRMTSGNIDSIDTELPAAASAVTGPSASSTARPDETPHYDFYDVLTGREVRMSDAELAATARAEEERRARAVLTQQNDTLPAPLPESSGASNPASPATAANSP
ncbi:MAG: sporulation protein, partial [Xanthomonadaceae bacterium]|nr:sporulation protein [Xanthomonadaceae bacterium]